MTKSQDYRDGFTAGLLAGMAEVDKAVKALTSSLSGMAAGVQSVNQKPLVVTVHHRLEVDQQKVKDIASQVCLDTLGRVTEAMEKGDEPDPPDSDESDAAPPEN